MRLKLPEMLTLPSWPVIVVTRTKVLPIVSHLSSYIVTECVCQWQHCAVSFGIAVAYVDYFVLTLPVRAIGKG